MKLTKILYWIFFILGAIFCVLNMFVEDIAITICGIIVLLIAIICFFINSSLIKKQSQIPDDNKKKVELQKKLEDSYKRIREEKKNKKNK